jgi:hypothetical protein
MNVQRSAAYRFTVTDARLLVLKWMAGCMIALHVAILARILFR